MAVVGEGGGGGGRGRTRRRRRLRAQNEGERGGGDAGRVRAVVSKGVAGLPSSPRSAHPNTPLVPASYVHLTLILFVPDTHHCLPPSFIPHAELRRACMHSRGRRHQPRTDVHSGKSSGWWKGRVCLSACVCVCVCVLVVLSCLGLWWGWDALPYL